MKLYNFFSFNSDITNDHDIKSSMKVIRFSLKYSDISTTNSKKSCVNWQFPSLFKIVSTILFCIEDFLIIGPKRQF